ncbi:MAG: alpha/beta hydrolase [Muriicola sp.]|nr:alpha/beta hydrolase [Muriicola sp.]NNK10948.1 alpha/beta hydrolase [Flavobacteriaceae bacterium]
MTAYFQRILPKIYGLYFNITALFSEKSVAKKAFLLFSTPRKGRVLPIQESFLKDAKFEKVEVEDIQIQTYHWEGKGKRVLLLHGWESNTYRWRNMIGFLKKEGFDIIAFDAPAHGWSTGKIFHVIKYSACTKTIVDRYKPDYIIGHSVGGMTAVYHQYLWPKNSLRKIVTIGSPSEMQDVMDQYQRILNFNDSVMRALNQLIIERFGFGITDFSTSEFAKELDIDGLLIHDKYDTIAPYRASEKVHQNWKGSQLISTEGLGHSMHQDFVCQNIIDFLNS